MLEELVEPIGVPHQTPAVDFTWGRQVWSGQITSLLIAETMFTSNLRPARLAANVEMTVLRIRKIPTLEAR